MICRYRGSTSSVRTRMCSMDNAYHQYGGGTSSVRTWVCSTGLSAQGLVVVLLPDLNFYTGKTFDFPRFFLVHRSQSLFRTLPIQRPY